MHRLLPFLKRRGYSITRDTTIIRDFIQVDCVLPGGRGDIVHVYLSTLPPDQTVGKKTISNLISYSSPSTVSHVILICAKISRQSIHMFRTYRYFELLSMDDLFIERFDHKYVPRYERLSKEEIVKVCQKYGDCTKFPRIIAKTDAVARMLGFRRGDVLVAYIKCPYRGNIVEYRYVV